MASASEAPSPRIHSLRPAEKTLHGRWEGTAVTAVNSNRLQSLIAYLVLKDRSPWLKESVTEALNFSILYTIAQVVASILTVVVIGAILLPLIGIAALILCILAAIASNKGEQYKYPVNWRLIK